MSFDPDSEAKRFNQKASRIYRAIELVPSARGFEVLPFCALLQSKYRTTLPRVQDMMGGTGYLASYLQEISQSVLVVDISVGMLKPAIQNNLSVLKTAGRFSEPELARAPSPDVVTSLAGLHHIFQKNGPDISQASSRALRHEIIARWLNWISSSGVMILADVPISLGGLRTGLDLKETGESHITILQPLYSALSSFLAEIGMQVPHAPTIKWVFKDLPNRLMERFNGLPGIMNGPAQFFNQFVANHSEVGHDACFLSAGEFSSAFPSWNAILGYLPTPWLFPDLKTAIWYVKEKFAIGERSLNPDEVSESEERLIKSALEEFLGLDKLSSGKVIFGWGLMFVVLTKKDQMA